MNRSVRIFVEGMVLDLFDDETISVNSSVQNINDISKVYTDFSQGFSIPATKNNNRIYQYFYESDVDSTIDQNIRRSAVIEIDNTFFRRGKIAIEKSTLKNGQAYSYEVTFYGDTRSLLDTLGDSMLSDLDYSSLNHEWTSDEVYNRITDATDSYDVKYPLITSNRIWQYQSQLIGATTPNWLNLPSLSGQNNIHSTSGAINKNELFPAVRVSKIWELIEAQFGVTFNGNFLTDPKFTKLFLYYKNATEFTYNTPSVDFDFTAKSSVPITPTPNYVDVAAYLTASVDLANDTIRLQETGIDILQHSIRVQLLTLSVPVNMVYVDVYRNGNYLQTLQRNTIGFFSVIDIPNASGLDDLYTFQVRATDTCNVQLQVRYAVSGYSDDPSGTPVAFNNYIDITCAAISLLAYTNLESLAPSMKISDFMKGIMQQMNITSYSLEADVYNFETLESWYNNGNIYDITDYTDVNETTISKVPLFKRIDLKYQQSEAVLNRQFAQLFNREYGDVLYDYQYDGQEYTIEVPFENLLQNKFTGTDLMVGYCLNNEFAPYVPKPLVLYLFENQTCDFKFVNDSGGHYTVTSYTPMSQDMIETGVNYTLNFSAEISPLLDATVSNTLFYTYYFAYLSNLYNLKNRFVTAKTNLPISILTNLQLNDRLVIKDKRYLINDFKSNLRTGEVEFNLLLDFRGVLNPVVIPADPNGGFINIGIDLPNGAATGMITTTHSDVLIEPAEIEFSQNVKVTYGAAPVPQNFVTEKSKTLITEDGLHLVTEYRLDSSTIILDVEITMLNGDILNRKYYLVQE